MNLQLNNLASYHLSENACLANANMDSQNWMHYTSSHVAIMALLHLISTSEMIHHHGVSPSKQQTTDLLLCHGRQQDLSLSTVTKFNNTCTSSQVFTNARHFSSQGS